MLLEGGVGGRGREKAGLERWKERGCRQTRGRRRCKVEESTWAKVWSRTGEEWRIWGMPEVGMVGADHIRERGWVVVMLAGALKVRLRNLDFILREVRIMEGLVKGMIDMNRLHVKKMALVPCRGWTGRGWLKAEWPGQRFSSSTERPKSNRTDKVILSSYLPNSSIGLLFPGHTNHLVVPSLPQTHPRALAHAVFVY